MSGVAICLLLAGCGGAGDRDGGPVAWWHGLEGGPIAAQRPPPPGADAPYPNFSALPARPKPIDPASRASTYGALASDRANATYEAAQDPLTTAAPVAANGLFAAAKPLPAADPDAAGAALEGATPKPPAAVAKTDVAKAAAAPAVVAPAGSAVDTPIPDIAADATPAPVVPDAPPAPPVLAGVSIPVTTPHLPPIAPPPPAAVVAGLSASDTAPLSFAFTDGSAILTDADRVTVRQLAFRRGNHGIEIIGFGESDGQDPQSQYAGVKLGLARARAIAAALQGWTVPMSALHLAADAPGRGAAARLVD